MTRTAGPALLLLTLIAASPQGQAPRWIRGVPDVSGAADDLGLVRLEAPAPIRFVGGDPDLREEAGVLRRDLLEARAFWRNLLGASVEGGLLLADSAVWIAMVPDTWYGLPGTRVRTGRDGVLALMAHEKPTRFGEEAGELVGISPTAVRGLLVAHGLDSVEGAQRYADVWRWVLLAEDLSEGLRIGAEGWWQRRIVGAAGAWLFLEAPRGEELVPDGVDVLHAWGWFFRAYYRSIALPLSGAVTGPPAGDIRRRLELDARLLAFGRDLADRYGTGLFARLRAAWPVDDPEMEMEGALEALFRECPDLVDWKARLLDPRTAAPAPRPPH